MIIDKLIKDPAIKRHVAKTITWRIVGSIDTMFLGWLVTGNIFAGIKIGGLEIITKMTFYFIHERIWYKINFGLPHRQNKPEA